jgi:hypothetical protein
MREIKLLMTLGLGLLALGGCAAAPTGRLSRRDQALVSLDLAHTRRAGLGARFRPPAMSPAVLTGARVGSWRCLPGRVTTYGAHVELFAEQRGMVVPAGIGINGPRFHGYRVAGGRCAYPLQTVDPTGLVEVGALRGASPPRLGELFGLWGQPLASDRLASFTGAVRAYVDGRRWRGDPRLIPLRRHTQIVLELGGFVVPHSSYGFPGGL